MNRKYNSKTTPKVVDGKVQKKDNHAITAREGYTVFQDANNWNLSKFYGPGWVLLDNRDFSEAAWDVISSTYELPLLEGFVCEEACPTLVTEEALEIWYKQLTTVLMQPNINPVVLEIAKALYGLVQLVKHDHGLRLTVQGLL